MKHILISTGDVSADLHAAQLVTSLKQHDPELTFSGMGGLAMAQAGVEILIDSRSLGMIGVLDLFSRLGKIFQAYRCFKQVLTNNPPDLLILIDYSGFNLRLAKMAKRAGVKTLYYIAPQIWASRPQRIKNIKKYVDHVAVLFPFEKAIYERADVPVTFVGHPLAQSVQCTLSPTEARETLNLKPDCLTIGLLPGSRSGEIKHLMPVLLESAHILTQRYSNIQFVLPLAPHLTPDDFQPYLENNSLPVSLIQQQTYTALRACDAVIIASGTATLETALLGIPMVIIYKVEPITYHIGKYIIKVPYIGLCNIVAEQKIVAELIQHAANAENIVAEISRIIDDEPYRKNMLAQLAQVQQKLGTTTADSDITQVVLQQILNTSRI